MDRKEKIIQELQRIVRELTNEDIKVELSIPKDDIHGDYTSNVALRLAKILGKNPLEIAKDIAEKIMLVQSQLEIEKTEAVAPGFINFYLSKEALIKSAEEILENPEKAGTSASLKNKKAVVEYSSPNIAKPFTIGHLRSTIIGDAIANLLEAIGYTVYRDNHLGDWGTQFGKQIYAIKHWGDEKQLDAMENPVKELVLLYVKFHKEAEKHPEIEDEARLWFKKLEDGDTEARRLWQKCIAWSWKEFSHIYNMLGVRFSENNGKGYGESYFEDKMQPVIDELQQKQLLKEDKGARLVFFPHDAFPPLMIMKKDGATLYATRDLATDKFRLQHYGKDILVINEVGSEQSLYFKQLFALEELLGWYKKGQRIHVGHGLFKFKEGKMSTRKGNTIWLEDVLKEAIDRAFTFGRDDWNSTNHSQSYADEHIKGSSETQKIAEQVGIGALKWNDLKRNPLHDIIFNWDEVLNMQGNAGPYVQYVYTRTQSLLEKARANTFSFPANYSPNTDEMRLLSHIQKFAEIVQDAALSYSPNVVTEYLFTLCQLFNNFYQKYRILNAATEEEKQFRLALTASIGIVIKQGLYLLGIHAPEKM